MPEFKSFSAFCYEQAITDNRLICNITGAADDLELVSWLCERIWVLQGNFTNEDGYAAARISIAEMLKTGTTCFLESMVSSFV
jgi:cytosine/adenosine deaminase-related metal-dependent hydrolase